MGVHNRKSPDHGKPQPRVATRTHQTHAPAPKQQGHGKAKGRSNRVSPAWYIVFIAALALLATAAISAIGAQ